MPTKKTPSDQVYSPLTIRLPNRLRSRLEEACAVRQRSISAVVEEILDRAVPRPFPLEQAARELQSALRDYCYPTGEHDDERVLQHILNCLKDVRQLVEREIERPSPPWKRNPDWSSPGLDFDKGIPK